MRRHAYGLATGSRARSWSLSRSACTGSEPAADPPKYLIHQVDEGFDPNLQRLAGAVVSRQRASHLPLPSLIWPCRMGTLRWVPTGAVGAAVR